MTLSIIAYKFNREPHNWCGGVFRDGTDPVIDSAQDGIGFKRAERATRTEKTIEEERARPGKKTKR